MVFLRVCVWFCREFAFGFRTNLRLVLLRVRVWFFCDLKFGFCCDFAFGFVASSRLFFCELRLVFCEIPFGLVVNLSLCFCRICVWLFGEFPLGCWGNQRVVFEDVAFSCYEFAHAVCLLRNWVYLLLLFPMRFSP